MEYIFIKQKDEYCVSQEMFRNFLCVNKRIEFKNEEDNKSDIIIFDGKKLEYGLESTEVEKSNEMIFHLMVEMQGDGEAQADILEHFDFLIKEINEKMGRNLLLILYGMMFRHIMGRNCIQIFQKLRICYEKLYTCLC